MNKKVGIVSCYFKNNYGSMLQAYALKRVLDDNKIPNETVNIKNNVDFKKGKKKYYMHEIFNYKFLKSKSGMIKMKLKLKINKKLGKNVSIRNKKYEDFRKEFNLSPVCSTYSDLTKYTLNNYSNVIVGSDQLWLPVNVVSDYYTLNWVPNDINKISYATSFGVSNIPNKYKDLYDNFLKRINHLSVRENSGVNIIKEVSNLESNVVCDPTILLNSEEWDEISTKERIIKEKYILCYFLGKNIKHRKFAEKLKEKTSYKIVSLNHADEYVPYSDRYCDYAPYDIGPREWINLIKNAEIVLTDSFHGTVFSLIYNKCFFSFRRYDSSDLMSTNSRIDSILDNVEVDKNRLLSGDEEVEEVLSYQIDYEKVNKKINILRENSKKWLFDSINKDEKEKTIEKVKVLMFVDRMRHGGIQQFILDNIKHINKEKIQIDVLTLDDGQTYPLEQEVVEAGANFYKIKGLWINKPWDYIKYQKKIKMFFKQHHDYKIIHMNASSKNFMLLKYAKKYKIRVRIAHSHNIDFQTKNILKKIIGNILKRPMRKYATDYFACSSLAGEWLFGKKNVNNGNVKIIHNAVDYDKFKFNKNSRKEIRNEFKIEDDTLLFGNVGRFTTQKNHTFLIDIFNEIHKIKNNTKLVLVGTGEKETEIRKKVDELGLSSCVIFAGYRNDVNKIMQAMDVFLLPSLYEGLPVVGVEAQATGLPCFTSRGVVTNEAKITYSFNYISLKKSAQEWAETILNSDLTRKNTEKDLKNAGYFIEDSAKELEEYYLRG